MQRIVFVLLCCLTPCIFWGQEKKRIYLFDEASVPREKSVDFQHLRLQLDFEPEKGLVKGDVTHTFITQQQSVDSLFVDGIDMQISTAKLNGKEIKYTVYNKGITFYFPALDWRSKNNLQIVYTCQPQKGIYFIGWNDPNGISRKQIWTQGQGIDNRHWIPMYDEMNDKITSEISFSFDSKYKVLSNGVKIAEKPGKDGKTFWHYKMNKPHAPYLIMLGIGEYKIKSIRSKGGVPIHLWYYPDMEDRVETTYRYSAEMMDYFEQEIGVKYPWEQYSQIPVQDFMYGAMENTTATVFGDFFLVDKRAYHDRNYVAVNAHELAHQWFGDMVTARSTTHHWLQESFATFYNWLYEREAFGEDHYNWNRRNVAIAAINETKKDLKPIANSSAGSTRHYPKGAHVLHMLKYVCGREQYNAAIKYYLEKHGYQNVDSEDLLVAFHEYLGLSLDWFWEQWVYKGGEPHYNISYHEAQIESKPYHVFEVDQVHETNEVLGLFKMPFWFEVHYEDGTKKVEKIWIENKKHVVRIPAQAGKKVAYVLFDPGAQVLKEYTFEKPLAMLEKQALNAEHMRDRFDAVIALRDVVLDKKKNLLLQVFKKEAFHAVKAEIISQLFASDSPYPEFIKLALNDKQSEVRRAVLDNTKQIPSALLSDYEKLLADSSYSTIEKALEILCFHFPEKTTLFLEKTKDFTGAVGNNLLIKRLEMDAFYNKNMQAANKLVEYTSESYEFRTRVNAVQALVKLNFCTNELLENLAQGSTKANGRLAEPCTKALAHFYAQHTYSKQIEDFFSNRKYCHFPRLKEWCK